MTKSARDLYIDLESQCSFYEFGRKGYCGVIVLSLGLVLSIDIPLKEEKKRIYEHVLKK